MKEPEPMTAERRKELHEWLEKAEREAATELPGIASVIGKEAAEDVLKESARTRGLFRELLDEVDRLAQAVEEDEDDFMFCCLLMDALGLNYDKAEEKIKARLKEIEGYRGWVQPSACMARWAATKSKMELVKELAKANAAMGRESGA